MKAPGCSADLNCVSPQCLQATPLIPRFERAFARHRCLQAAHCSGLIDAQQLTQCLLVIISGDQIPENTLQPTALLPVRALSHTKLNSRHVLIAAHDTVSCIWVRFCLIWL